MLDYIVPIIAAVIIQSFINSTPQLTMTPTETFSDEVSVEVNGKKNSRVFVNGLEVATIEEDGNVIINLNTSGVDGSKDFEITLHDNANHISKTLSFSLEKTTVTRRDAIKLLRQAAFVSNESHIDYIMANGEKAWIENQLNIVGDLDKIDDKKYGYLESMTRFLNKNNSDKYPASLYTNTDAYPEEKDSSRLTIFNRSLWWQKALHNEDQLRQRVAYALSQLIVVGKDGSNHLGMRGEGAAHYYDILVKHAFGNYGNLLKEISMNPIMADYLTYVASSKDNNVTGTSPDENYARELMQLFSVGLYELNDDGTRILNDNNLPTPIYTQDDVSEMARVFTGWALSSNNYNEKKNNKYKNNQTYMHSYIMEIRDDFAGEYHDFKSKIVLKETINAGLTPKEDINRAIDILMANKNTGPHICRELINRLVTSNPSKTYMKDIVDVFNSGIYNKKGSGIKGDLKVTIEAILTHDEARKISSDTHGKVDEFMLLTTHYLSSLNVKPLPEMSYTGTIDAITTVMEDVYWFTPDTQYYHQTPLEAPSVFNFYSPEYIPNDSSFSQMGIVAPEFEQRTYNGLIAFSNYISFNLKQDRYIYEYIDTQKANNPTTFTNMTDWVRTKGNMVNKSSFNGLYIDTTEIYKKFSMLVDGNENLEFKNLNAGTQQQGGETALSENAKVAVVELIDYLDNHFTGGITPQEYKDKLALHLYESKSSRNYIMRQATNIVGTAIRAIIMSPSYMVIK